MSENLRSTPVNELDMQLMIVNSEWGKNISSELDNKLQEDSLKLVNGNYTIEKKKLWGLLSYYTRDMRLGNLGNYDYVTATEWLNFAGDCLRYNYVKSFLTCLSRVITILELSQSKGGFLRKRLGTFTQESYQNYRDENEKKGLWGEKKKTNNRR